MGIYNDMSGLVHQPAIRAAFPGWRVRVRALCASYTSGS